MIMKRLWVSFFIISVCFYSSFASASCLDIAGKFKCRGPQGLIQSLKISSNGKYYRFLGNNDFSKMGIGRVFLSQDSDLQDINGDYKKHSRVRCLKNRVVFSSEIRSKSSGATNTIIKFRKRHFGFKK